MKRFPFSSRIAAAAMGIFLAAAVPETNLFTNDMGQAGLMTVYGAPKLEADPAKEASVYTTAGYVCRIDAPEVNIYKSANENVPVIWTAKRGETLQVLGRLTGGWALVDTDSGRGYLKTSEGASVLETATERTDKSAAARNQVVKFALQFVGSRYVYGGNDPRTGVDCSGFTSYVMKHGAGIQLNRSSRGQASQGRPVSAAEIRPGDLIFYSSGGRINHVALYIGNGQVVHASTEKTGVKISNWNYREPAKIVSVL